MDFPTTNPQIGRLLRSERVERLSIDALRQRHVCGGRAPRTVSLRRGPRPQQIRLAA
jgi:hypothetical protein